MKSTTITLRVPLELIQQLDDMAETTQRSRSALGCEALRRYLDLEAHQTASTRPIGAAADAGGFLADANPVPAAKRRAG